MDKLDLYIDEHIINYVSYKRKIDENTGEEYYEKTLPLNFLEKINLTDEEFEYVFNRLNDKGILVAGDSPVLYGDFDNYRCVQKFRYSKPKELYDAKKCNELMYKLKSMKVETEEEQVEYGLLRKKLISMNVRLVDYIIGRLNYGSKFNIDELSSYGYEGLIMAVDRFDPNKGGFYSFAKNYILGYINRGMKNLKGFSTLRFASKYIKAKTDLEQELGIVIDDDIDFIDEIANKIYLQDKRPIDTVEQIKTRISLMNILSLDEMDDEFYDDNTLYQEVIEPYNKEFLRDDLESALSKLSDIGRRCLIVKYGLNDEIDKTGSETAKIIGCKSRNVYVTENMAICKLKNYASNKKLRDYYASMGEYDYSPCGIETVNVKQKSK